MYLFLAWIILMILLKTWARKSFFRFYVISLHFLLKSCEEGYDKWSSFPDLLMVFWMLPLQKSHNHFLRMRLIFETMPPVVLLMSVLTLHLKGQKGRQDGSSSSYPLVLPTYVALVALPILTPKLKFWIAPHNLTPISSFALLHFWTANFFL